MVDLLQWRSATDLVNKQKSPEAFILERVFKQRRTHLATKVDFEIIVGSQSLAQFRNRRGAAKQVNKRGRTVKTVSLPETAEFQFFTPEELFMNKAFGDGNPYVQNPGQIMNYRNMTLADSMQELRDRVQRRREQLCAAALQGKITYSVDDIEFEVDFGYQNNVHLITLAGAEKWDQAGVKILKPVRGYKSAIQKRSGFPATLCLMGSESADLFLENEDVMKKLDTLNYRVGSLDTTGETGVAATYLGKINGVEYWEYTQAYTDEQGNEQLMIAKNKAVFIAPNAPFRWHNGPIFREEGISTQEFFSRTWEDKNPSGTNQEVASSGLPCVHDPDAVICVTTH